MVDYKNAHISARRWFDKRNGNTYHSVSVRLSDGTTLTNSFEYGYGEHYFHTAGVLLKLDAPYKCGHWTFRQENGITVECVDVARRSDLHNGGKLVHALVGKRVEIAPSYDLWMRGARFGTVVKVDGKGIASVKMDHPQVKRSARIPTKDLTEV